MEKSPPRVSVEPADHQRALVSVTPDIIGSSQTAALAPPVKLAGPAYATALEQAMAEQQREIALSRNEIEAARHLELKKIDDLTGENEPRKCEPLTPAQRRKLLVFVTGVSRLPARHAEFLTVELPFLPFGVDEQRRMLAMVPQSHTCDNILELPNYWEALLKTKTDEARPPRRGSRECNALERELRRIVREKLLVALDNAVGYGLDALEPHVTHALACAAAEDDAAAAALLASSRAMREAERFPSVKLEIIATDVDDMSLRRAKAGVFDVHAVANLPVEWVASCFQLLDDGRYELAGEIRQCVTFSKGDAVSDQPPEGPFDLVLARYSLFLYLAPEDARRALEKVRSVLKGTLVTGLSDSLPQDHALQYVQGAPNGVYRCSEGEPPSPNDGRPATLTELLGLEERLGTKREPPPKRVTVSRGSRRILEKTSRGEDPFPEHRFPRTASMGVAPEPEPLARPRTAVAFGSTGPLPASPPRRPRSARVAPPEPARRPAPPPAPARRKKVLPEAARAALFDRLQRPASAPVKKRAVKSGPTWIIKSEPRPEYVAPPRKSLRSADARKVVERLYTADCARREERVQANAKAYFRPATRRRRKGKKAVRSFLSRLRRSDAKRKKRLKAIRDAVFAAERGVERTAEDAVGLQNLSRLAAAPRPPPPTRRPPPPPANSLSGSSGSSGGGSSGRLAFSTGTGASGSRGQFIPARPRTADQGYTSRCARPRSARTAPVAPTRPTVRYRMATAVGAVEVAASPSGKLRHGPKRMDVTSLLRRAYCEPKVLLAPP